MALRNRGRLVVIAAVAALALGIGPWPFAGRAAATTVSVTVETHGIRSAKMWQCSYAALGTWCAWVQYEGSYQVTATRDSDGSTYWLIRPMWSGAYIWNGRNTGYNTWSGTLGAMHTVVTIYSSGGRFLNSTTLSPGTCGGPAVVYPYPDLYIRYCSSVGNGVGRTQTTNYPAFLCFRTYFDTTFVFGKNLFAWNSRNCLWIYI